MAKDILHQLEQGKDGFSKGQKRIASYILENYDKAAFMTASRLGLLAGVSESTVVRFASELGYDGYPSMQRALQDRRETCFLDRIFCQRSSSLILTSCVKCPAGSINGSSAGCWTRL